MTEETPVWMFDGGAAPEIVEADDGPTQRVLVHHLYPDDDPLEMRYSADGTVEQLSGPPGVVMEVPVSEPGPTMTVRIEHSPEDGPTWTELKP